MTLYKKPDRTVMPKTGKQLHLKLDEPTHIKLDNGIDTYIIDEGEEDITRLDVIFDAGSSLQSKSLVAASTIRLLIDGTKNLSSANIAQKIDFHGAYLDTSLTKDKASLTLYILTKHLSELLPIISDMIVNASFPDSELTNYIDRKRHQFLVNTEKVRYKAMLEFNKMVFGSNSAYGRTVELSDYDNLKRSDLVEFYNSHFVPENTYIIISGKIKSNTISLINNHLGNVQKLKTPAAYSELNIINKVGEKDKFVKKDGALQSAIRIGMPIISKQHPDYNSLIVLNTVLGGYFGSRLMSNLRENKGFTYGVSSYLMNYKHGGFFSIATEVNAQNTNAALDEIHTEIEKLCNERISNVELGLVKNYIYGTYLRSFDGAMSLADRFRAARDLNLNFEYYTTSLNEMMKQTPQQLKNTAIKYFNYNDMIKLVVGSMNNNTILG